jgi:hypothetical protein
MLNFPKGYGLGYGQILKGNGFKPPLLVVGCNNYIRSKVGADVVQNWDVHVMFFPTSETVWRIGILYISRIGENVMLTVCDGTNIEAALIRALIPASGDATELHSKALVWLTHAVYRCPKISLRDILALEPYENVKKIA